MQGSKLPIIPPLEDPESAFRKRKTTTVGEASKKTLEDKNDSFEKTNNKMGAGYKPETSDSEKESKEESESERKDEMANIADTTMET